MGPKRKVEAIMAKVYWKGSTLLAPVSPTMVTCGSSEKPNIITIAWTGIVNSQPPMTYISVRPSRYSYELLKETGEFVIESDTGTAGPSGGLVRCALRQR